MSDTGDRSTGDATTFAEALDEAFETVLEMQDLVEVSCPQSGCTEMVAVPASSSDEEVAIARTEAVSEDDHKERCLAGHDVFVHYR